MPDQGRQGYHGQGSITKVVTFDQGQGQYICQLTKVVTFDQGQGQYICKLT